MTDQLLSDQITKVFTSPTQYIEVTISDSDIVPDAYQAELIQMRESWVKQYFRVGDIANELVQRSVQQNMPVTAIRIYKAIGNFCGKATRTVRYYAENALFFSPDSRDEYGFLPFAFFDLARNYGKAWQEVLEYAALHPAISYDELILVITANLTDYDNGDGSGLRPIERDQEEITNEDFNAVSSQVSLSKSAKHNELRLSQAVTPDAMKFIVELGVVIDRVYQALRSFEIPDEMSDQIAFHLNALRKCVAEALRHAQKSADAD